MGINMGWPKPWVLVLIGLLMNVLAMLISSTQIDRLTQHVELKSEQRDSNTYAIQLAWNGIDSLERKKEWLLLHLAQAKKLDVAIAQLIAEQMANWLIEPPNELTLGNGSLWIEKMNQRQQQHREQIDQYYLENLSLTESIASQQYRIVLFKNWALFLQVLGLALILARDLARK